MNLKGIISVSGMSGLYKVIAQTKSGFIIESLADKKRAPIHASNRVSALEDISVFKVDGDIPLAEVLKRIKEAKGDDFSFDPKADQNALRKDFKSIIPEFDEERVYNSDIKKIFTWFSILKNSDHLIETKEQEPAAEEKASPAKKTKAKAEPSAKTAAPKTIKPASVKVKPSEPKQAAKTVRTQKKGA